jgi:hypothetical protein
MEGELFADLLVDIRNSRYFRFREIPVELIKGQIIVIKTTVAAIFLGQIIPGESFIDISGKVRQQAFVIADSFAESFTCLSKPFNALKCVEYPSRITSGYSLRSRE